MYKQALWLCPLGPTSSVFLKEEVLSSPVARRERLGQRERLPDPPPESGSLAQMEGLV